ncbi:hypothetical protein [Paraoerskovia marina]|uniref:hypothetical protein n=1 Tax=Paraoerskovia marina TaxID=545619 RepID=UPI0006946693|nr:hypothetical protein [Paraoerskovia marina]
MNARPIEQTTGDDAVLAATGRRRAQWFEILDAAGAREMRHPAIAALLVESHDVDGWWAQSVTVAYEQARGLRRPGQRADGTYEVNASRTIAASRAEVFAFASDDVARALWLDAALGKLARGDDPVEIEVVGATAPSSVRWRWPTTAVGGGDGRGRVILGLSDAPDRADGTPSGKVRAAVQHTRIEDPDDVPALKEFWKARLHALGRLVEG